MKYRKKPVVIEAVIWTGKNFDEVSNFTKNFHGHKKAYEDAEEGAIESGKYSIHTLEGWITASPGDFIIKGVQGEFYPCKPDIFEKTYQSAEESTEVENGWVKDAYVPYQKCPVCDGRGVTIPLYDNTSVFEQCRVCNGAMIIPMHPLPQPPTIQQTIK